MTSAFVSVGIAVGSKGETLSHIWSLRRIVFGRFPRTPRVIIPQRTQISCLKANRWPPAVRSKVIADPHAGYILTAVIGPGLSDFIPTIGDIHCILLATSLLSNLAAERHEARLRIATDDKIIPLMAPRGICKIPSGWGNEQDIGLTADRAREGRS